MITYTETWLILDRREVTPSVASLIDGWVATGTERTRSAIATRVRCASEEDAAFKTRQIEAAWDADAPPDEDDEDEPTTSTEKQEK